MDIDNLTNSTESSVIFTCPNCGVIAQEDVVFLCNSCNQNDLIFKDNMYMCPACLKPGHNFQCMLCDSKDVTMKHKKS